ncbi:hypothetical protein GT347_09810 [Xylophilus rhododendri]|uniref:Uncharacterized protein n=1 Tax=Xylophilus rhododendri TaxID=2697032 RepID=A0A857J4X3_9BURK|nr:DUF6502 family protein [Xylophilus rhododendri]QHI98263.1 hypothetical protein GT347_09810 [Xylophilus rhododendri]
MPTEPESAALNQPSQTLAHVLRVMRPLARWLVRAGVGHKLLAEALKPVFLEAARAELQRHGQRETDSGLSVLSGLHRKDVRALGEEAASELPPERPARATPAQVLVSRWLAEGLPLRLPVAGDSASFDALARGVSLDVHPRTLMRELLRLGVAAEEGDFIELRREAFVPDRAHAEAGQMVADSVADHLAAGVHNLTGDGPVRFLEQSVFADQLSEASVRELEALGNQLWKQVLGQMVQAATVLEARDAALGSSPAVPRADQRIRLGMFCYSTRMAALNPPASAPEKDPTP